MPNLNSPHTTSNSCYEAAVVYLINCMLLLAAVLICVYPPLRRDPELQSDGQTVTTSARQVS